MSTSNSNRIQIIDKSNLKEFKYIIKTLGAAVDYFICAFIIDIFVSWENINVPN